MKVAAHESTGVFLQHRAKFGSLELSVTDWSGENLQRLHCHATPRFVVLLSGTFEERSGGVCPHCVPGTTIFRPPYVPHENRYARCGGRYLSVAVEAQWLIDHGCDDMLREQMRYLSDVSIVPSAVRVAREALSSGRWSRLTLEAFSLELVARVGRAVESQRASRVPAWFGEACAALRDRRVEPLSVLQLADLVGIPPLRLAREFRRHAGMGLGAYARTQRLERARTLIERS
ncbi:MAG: hypothetical protein JO060_00565, partial [Candidatus Eremiobacteraeota bacterium]|nr:hypothetical protein [Candidatus Eremiobacteraeota bacterium]